MDLQKINIWSIESLKGGIDCAEYCLTGQTYLNVNK